MEPAVPAPALPPEVPSEPVAAKDGLCPVAVPIYFGENDLGLGKPSKKKSVFNLIATQAITTFTNLKQKERKPSGFFTTQSVNCQIAKAVFYFLIMTMWSSEKFQRKG